MIARITCLTIILLLCYTSSAQEGKDDRFPFLKENGKIKWLKADRYIDIHLVDSFPKQKFVDRVHIKSGLLRSTSEDSLFYTFSTERWSRIVRDPENQFELERSIHVVHSPLCDTLDQVASMPASAIDQITYDPTFYQVGTFVTVISALGILVYAPLKAMRFKDGTFNGERYLRIAGPCAIGFGAGLIIMPFTNHQKQVKFHFGKT